MLFRSPIGDIDEALELARFCEEHDVPLNMLTNMVIEVDDFSKYARRRNIYIRLKEKLDKQLNNFDAIS